MGEPLPLKILIIEDDLDTCDNLGDILQLDDHEVTFAHTAAQALSSAEISSATTILLDWKLPDGTAPDLLPTLKKVAPDADVIIITGYGEFDKAVSALRQGAADYLLKPINPEALRGSLQRLAHRRWLAQEKSRHEAMFSNLVQAAQCLILILKVDLSIVYINPFAEQLTGYAADEVIGKKFSEIFLEDSDVGNVDQFLGKFGKGCETAMRCRDGTVRWLIWNAQLQHDANGERSVLAVGQDVTEHRRATEQLVQSERLAAIGEAMTGLAHESRNALQRSQAYLELLAVEVQDRPEAMKLVAKIQHAQNHLHQLYEEVREYAAPLRIEPMECQLDQLIEETWSHLEHARAGRHARLLKDSGYCPPHCRCDRFMMQQVFRNILENSLAACADPVAITYAFEPWHDHDGRWIRMSIRDNGPGLSAEQRKRIFDPFFTTKTRGTGLGMTLCKRIVEAHGGQIAVGEGPGAEIVIRIPVAFPEDQPVRS